MAKIMTNTGTPELGRESPVRTDEEVTTFGFGKEDLMKRLKTDNDFASTFMSEFSVLQQIVKEYQNSVKQAKATARYLVKQEKEGAERKRLKAIITKIQENDPDVVLEPEAVLGDFFEGSSIKYLKEWVKKYRNDVKEKKAAVKQAKADAKVAKEAAKQAKADAKAEKEEVLREKLLSQLPKLLEKVETFIVEYDEDTISMADLKILHSSVKMMGQLKQYTENVSHIPDVIGDDYDDIKEVHTRAKILNQYNRLPGCESELTYVSEKTNDEVKALIKEAKNAENE